MEPATDYIRLWQELVVIHNHRSKSQTGGDVWRRRAKRYHELVQRRWAKPDSSRELIAADLDAHPGSTVLDIGAGTGAWSVYLAAHAKSVTALDPSSAMVRALHENLAQAGVDNVAVVGGGWPEVEVARHDVSLCSHALYGAADFPAFIQAMVEATGRRCYLVLRAPTPDSVMAEAARHLWGQPYDSPNFQVGYNALLQMGILAHVHMEDSGLWEPWSHDTLEDALAEIQSRFDLDDDHSHDGFLLGLLQRRLTAEAGRYVWPRGVRSALVYWDV